MASEVQSNFLIFRQIDPKIRESNTSLKCVSLTILILGLTLLSISHTGLFITNSLPQKCVLSIGGVTALIGLSSFIYVSTRKIFSQSIILKNYNTHHVTSPKEDNKNLDYTWSCEKGMGFVARGENSTSSELNSSFSRLETEYTQDFENENITSVQSLYHLFMRKFLVLNGVNKPTGISSAQVVQLKDRTILLTAHRGNTVLILEKNKKIAILAGSDEDKPANLCFRCYDITGASRVVGLSPGFSESMGMPDLEAAFQNSNTNHELFSELNVKRLSSSGSQKSVSGKDVNSDLQDVSFFAIDLT